MKLVKETTVRTRFVFALAGLSLLLGLLMAPPSFAQRAPTTVVVPLVSTGNSGVSGTMTLQGTGNNEAQTAITVTARGLQPGQSYVAHVHTGSRQNPREIVAWLMDLTADVNGVATNNTTENLPIAALASGQAYANVHGGPALPADEIACGNIPALDVAAPRPLPGAAPVTGGLGLSAALSGALIGLGLLGLAVGLHLRYRRAAPRE